MDNLQDTRVGGDIPPFVAMKKQIVVAGAVTTVYKAYAQIGTAQATAAWVATKTVIDETTPADVSIITTHAPVDSVATDLTALSYS